MTCVHRWLQANLAQLGEGEGHHNCPIAGPDIAKPFTMKLHIRIIHSKGSDRRPLIRRYGPTNISGSVEKALEAKLPKLAKTPADVRILLLERSQWSLSETQIWQEIQSRRVAFPLLTKINEIWFAETVFYDGPTNPNWCDCSFVQPGLGGDLRRCSSPLSLINSEPPGSDRSRPGREARRSRSLDGEDRAVQSRAQGKGG